jgi:hypothetical protein
MENFRNSLRPIPWSIVGLLVMVSSLENVLGFIHNLFP